MDTNPLESLFGASEETRVAPQAAPEATLAPQAAPETLCRPGGPDGAFAARDAEAVPEPSAPARAPPKEQPPLTERETVGFYKAMQEERDRRQAAERKLAELEARTAPAEPLPPDQRQRIDSFLLRRDLSREFLVSRHGEETAAAVETWAADRCGTDPVFNQQMLSAKLPFDAAKIAWDREQILAEVKSPGDLAAFRAWRAEKSAAPAPAPSQQPPPSDPPPRSLANAPGTGSRGAAHVTVGEGSAYAALGL